jgi:hypothetical protein
MTVYFIYPETCGVRLEEMDSLFGDATTAMGTPVARGTPLVRPEADALVRPGSPVPSLDIRGRPQFGPGSAIPGLDIDPPSTLGGDADGKQRSRGREGGGITGWFSRLVGRGKTGDSSNSGDYEALIQGED